MTYLLQKGINYVICIHNNDTRILGALTAKQAHDLQELFAWANREERVFFQLKTPELFG